MFIYILLSLILVLIVYSLYMYLYMISMKKKNLLYPINGSKKIKVEKNIVYKNADSKNLLMDIYTPDNLTTDQKLPAVIFVHGEGPELFIKDAKDWGVYTGYGRLVASMGFAAVTFNHRYAAKNFVKIKDISKDVLDAVDYVKNNADKFNIHKDKICIWSFSLGGIYSSLFLKDNSRNIKCLVSYYGLLDIKSRISGTNNNLSDFTPENYLSNFYDSKISILIVKAAKDKVKGVNQSIDSFIRYAKQYNIKYKYIVHTTGGHSFDVLDDNDETRRIIEETLNYLKSIC